MFRVCTKKNHEYSKVERALTSLFSFTTFGFVGACVRLFYGTTTFGAETSLLFQFMPFILGFGMTAAILGYFYPKVLNILMCFIPVPGSTN